MSSDVSSIVYARYITLMLTSDFATCATFLYKTNYQEGRKMWSWMHSRSRVYWLDTYVGKMCCKRYSVDGKWSLVFRWTYSPTRGQLFSNDSVYYKSPAFHYRETYKFWLWQQVDLGQVV